MVLVCTHVCARVCGWCGEESHKSFGCSQEEGLSMSQTLVRRLYEHHMLYAALAFLNRRYIVAI